MLTLSVNGPLRRASVDVFQAMGIMALPANASRGWNNLSSLVDDIWHHAGDKSVDVSRD